MSKRNGLGARKSLAWAVLLASGVLALLLLGAPAASADPIKIEFEVFDDPGVGFNDPVLGAARVNALQFAGDLWGSFFQTSFPEETVRIGVAFERFADAGPFFFFSPGAGLDFPRAIVQHRLRSDVFLGRRHGFVDFDEDVDFFLDTTGDPGGRPDFVTHVLHQLGHVFGFDSSIEADGTYIGAPNVYDLFVGDRSGAPLLNLDADARAEAIASVFGLRWIGPNGVAGNGGIRPILAAVRPFEPDLNVEHLSDTFFQGSSCPFLVCTRVPFLMDTFSADGEVIRTLSAVERGMFQDLFWTLAPTLAASAEPTPEPATLVLFGGGLAGLLVVAWRRRRGRSAPRLSSTERPSASHTGAHLANVAKALAVLVGATVLLLGPTAGASATPIEIEFQYGDAGGEGFNDPVLGPQRRTALEFAGDLWGSFFERSFPGETVRVRVTVDPFPEGSPFGAEAGDLGNVLNIEEISFTPISLVNHLAGFEIVPSERHGRIIFNERRDFFLGITGEPRPDQVDFVTVTMHELGHVFGFNTLIRPDGTYGNPNDVPRIFDRFMVDSFGARLIDLAPSDRLAAATSGDQVFWDGRHGIAANGGVPPNLAAPTTFLDGHTLFHLSDSLDPEPLMSFEGSSLFLRTLSPVDRGVLRDLGWTVAPPAETPEPATVALFGIALAGVAALTWRRHRRNLR